MIRAPITAARRLLSAGLFILTAGALSACSQGSGSVIPGPPQNAPLPGGDVASSVPLQAYDGASGGPCEVSYDGVVWYVLPAGPFPPIDVQSAKCSAPGALHVNAAPSMPAWARPAGRTQSIFVATSLMEHPYAPGGVAMLHSIAHAAHIPMSWMIGNVRYLQEGNYQIFNQYHQSDGDDVEMEDNLELIRVGKERFPWYVPTVSAEGAGHERNITRLMSLGETAFWGITWNSLHVDLTSDMGAPWGTYCADIASYKRPSPNGNCKLLAFEWTARDLDRAYFTGLEQDFSTDPDDVLVRAMFSVTGGQTYLRALVDAYAAAGESTPLVMVSQQESPEMEDGAPGDAALMTALYQEAHAVGMQAMTLASAATAARAFSAQPRAVAFPFIPGGNTMPRYGSLLYPTTIDFHDNQAGMTFIGGHTTPSRLFLYSQDPVSQFNVPLVQFPNAQLPQLAMVATSKGKLYFHFHSTVALHYGVAIWSDANYLGINGSNVSIAGRAGAVITFDLPVGDSDQSVACMKCISPTFPLSL